MFGGPRITEHSLEPRQRSDAERRDTTSAVTGHDSKQSVANEYHIIPGSIELWICYIYNQYIRYDMKLFIYFCILCHKLNFVSSYTSSNKCLFYLYIM